MRSKGEHEKVCLNATEHLKANDKWFDPVEDLFLRFEQFPSRLIAQWRDGKLELQTQAS